MPTPEPLQALKPKLGTADNFVGLQQELAGKFYLFYLKHKGLLVVLASNPTQDGDGGGWTAQCPADLFSLQGLRIRRHGKWLVCKFFKIAVCLSSRQSLDDLDMVPAVGMLQIYTL